MTRVIRSRRMGRSGGEAGERPLYARMLRLRHLAPSGFLCFVFLEGAVVLGILLALAELVNWWGVLVLPATVAIMVKLNDVVAGLLAPPPGAPPLTGVADPRRMLQPAAVRSGPDDLGLSGARTVDLYGSVSQATTIDLSGSLSRMSPPIPARPEIEPSAMNGPSPSRKWVDRLDARQRWARQSATRRYE